MIERFGTDWFARLPSRTRLSLIYWLMNAIAALALLGFALRF